MTAGTGYQSLIHIYVQRVLLTIHVVSTQRQHCYRYIMCQQWVFSPVSWSLVLFSTYWGRVTHICDSRLTIIGSDNGLPPGRRQAIIWTNAGILLIGPLGTNFSEILIEISVFSFKKMRLKVSSAKRRPFCLGLNVLKVCLRNRRRCFLDGEAHVSNMITSWHENAFPLLTLFEGNFLTESQ